MVNSFHHQAVKDAGKHFRVTALSSDEVIEAIESSEFKPIMGVQWHPEWMGEEGGKIFQWLQLLHQAKVLSHGSAFQHLSLPDGGSY